MEISVTLWLSGCLVSFFALVVLPSKNLTLPAPPNITLATPNDGCPFNAPNANAPNVAVTSAQVILLVVFIVKKGKIKYINSW